MAEPWSMVAGGVAVRRDDAARVQLLRLRGADAAILAGIDAVLGLVLPTAPNLTAGEGQRALCLASGEYMLVDCGRPENAALKRAADPVTVSLVDLTPGLIRYRVEGSAARDLMAKGCTIDLHPSKFELSHCAQTAFAQVFVIIHQVSPQPAFHIVVESSYAHHMESWFEDAMVEFGIAGRLE